MNEYNLIQKQRKRETTMMKKMNIARALKEKNRLVGDINKAFSLFKQQNVAMVQFSVPEGTAFTRPDDDTLNKKRELNPEELYNQWQDLRKKLIALKTAISKANAGAAEILIELQEAKSALANIGSVPFDESERLYGNQMTLQIAYFKQKWFLDRQRDLTNRVNELQDQLDEYNASHFIEVDL